MSVRGERVVYRERKREVDYDEPQRRSYTTIKRYQVPDRDSDRRSAVFDNDEVTEQKITIRRGGDDRAGRSEVDFRSDRQSERGDRDTRREDIDIRITEREREPERRDVTYRVIERDSDRDTRGGGGRSEFRVVEREREIVRAPSPPSEERVREYRFERERDFSPPRTRDAERDYDVERYSKTTDYYGQPQPIIIRESAPQPIIIREERRAPQQIIIQRDEPQLQFLEREEVRNDQALTIREEPKAASSVRSVVAKSTVTKSAVEEVQKPQEEDYYYERRIREVRRQPDDIKPSDSASQYSSDDSYEYVRRERYIDDEPERHHKLHLAEGALAGAAAGGILSSHRKQQGKAGHTGRDVLGGAALGGLAAEVISRARSRGASRRRREYEDDRDYDDRYDDRRSRRDRRRSDSRSRSRSRSKSGVQKYGGIAAIAAVGALAGYALKKSGNKETVIINDRPASRGASRRRHRSRHRDDEALEEGNKAQDPAHRNRRIAQAGLATAAAAGIYERFRSKSRGARSKSRVRTGVPIVAAGLGGAALAGLYERNKASKAATRDAIVAEEMNRGRGRSRSRSMGPRAIDGRNDEPRIEYGADPVYRDGQYYDEEPGHYHRRDRSVGSSPDTRRRSRSRARDLATAGAAAGAGAAIAHEVRNRSRSQRRHDDYDDRYHDEYPHDDYITPPPQNGNNYPMSNYFPPPPTGDNAYAPYNPADYPPAAAGAPREAYGDHRYDQAQATAEARERQEDREMKQAARNNDAGNVSSMASQRQSTITTSSLDAMPERREGMLSDAADPSTPKEHASYVAVVTNNADNASQSDRLDDRHIVSEGGAGGSSTPRARSTSRVRFDLESNVAHSPIIRHSRYSSGADTSEDARDRGVRDEDAASSRGHRRIRRPSSTLMNDPYERQPRDDSRSRTRRRGRSRSNSNETVDMPARFDERGNPRSESESLSTTLSAIFSGRSHGSTARSDRHDSGTAGGGGAIEEMLKGLVNELFHGDEDAGRRGRQRTGR